MKSSNPSIPTRDTENDAVIFVSIELSKKSWLAAIHTPLADKIALHKCPSGDFMSRMNRLSGAPS